MNTKRIKIIAIVTVALLSVSLVIMYFSLTWWTANQGLGPLDNWESLKLDASVTGSNGSFYTIHLDIENTGFVNVTLDPATVLYNGRTASSYPLGARPVCSFNESVMAVGQNATGTIALPVCDTWFSGDYVEIRFTSDLMMNSGGGTWFTLPVPQFEAVQWEGAAATGGAPGNYTIYFVLRNAGTLEAILDPTKVLYNGKLSSEFIGDSPVCSFASTTLVANANTILGPFPEGTTGNITMIAGIHFVSRMNLEITVQTASGNRYPITIVLP